MIKNIKLLNVVKCKTEDSVRQVAKIMKENKIRHIFVEDENEKLAGIISPVDISNKLVVDNKNPDETKAKDIMNSPVRTVDVNQEVEFAMKLMMENNTITAPVVQDGKLIGLITYQDALQAMVQKVKNEEKKEQGDK